MRENRNPYLCFMLKKDLKSEKSNNCFLKKTYLYIQFQNRLIQVSRGQIASSTCGVDHLRRIALYGLSTPKLTQGIEHETWRRVKEKSNN